MMTGRTATKPACHMASVLNVPELSQTASDAAANTRPQERHISIAWRISVSFIFILNFYCLFYAFLKNALGALDELVKVPAVANAPLTPVWLKPTPAKVERSLSKP
jgi:hypothetical protein